MNRLIRHCVLLLTLFSSSVWANGFVGVQGGTLGPGVEVGATLTDRLQFRVQAYRYDYSTSGVLDDIRYDIDINLNHTGVLLDWQLTESGWYVSAGLFQNQLTGEGIARPAGTYQIGNNFYTGAQVGQVITDVDTPDYAPYAGLGWNLKGLQDSGFSLNLSAGAFFTGDPDVTMRATGPLFATGAFQQDLEQERQQLEKDLDALKIIPALQLGLQYRF